MAITSSSLRLVFFVKTDNLCFKFSRDTFAINKFIIPAQMKHKPPISPNMDLISEKLMVIALIKIKPIPHAPKDSANIDFKMNSFLLSRNRLLVFSKTQGSFWYELFSIFSLSCSKSKEFTVFAISFVFLFVVPIRVIPLHYILQTICTHRDIFIYSMNIFYIFFYYIHTFALCGSFLLVSYTPTLEID